MTQQRFRVRFSKSERVRYISHLDVLRSWERSLRRAELPLAYSQGFTPHPKLAFASPLPLGFVSEAEVMDVTLDGRVDREEFIERLAAQTSSELAVISVDEVPLTAPAPQAAMLWCDYRVVLDVAPESAQAKVEEFVARDSFIFREDRGERVREYDLRKACAWIRVSGSEAGSQLEMRLQADQEVTARPEAIVAALFPEHEAGLICRTNIVLDDPSIARELWRRNGQYH